MTEYVVKIEGRLHPELVKEYETFTATLPSFIITLEKGIVQAFPQTDVRLEAHEAREQLQQEMNPLLSVLSAEEGRMVTLAVTHVIRPTLMELATPVLVTYTISGPLLTAEEMVQRTFWSTSDPIYRDLLDFYTEAQGAPNPRPAGYKMVERLETKYKGRPAALNALGLVRRDVEPIVADQWLYQGDRHAKYDIGAVPARLDVAKRQEVLVVLKRIIQAYEQHICSENTN